MTVQLFLTLLVIFSAITSVATEAVKKLFGKNFNVSYNLLVLIIAMMVGCIGTIVYYLQYEMPITLLNVLYMLFIGVANWIGAMVGYDKVKQLISQIGGLS